MASLLVRNIFRTQNLRDSRLRIILSPGFSKIKRGFLTSQFIQQRSPSQSDRSTSIYTIPNAITLSRILISPPLGYWIVHGHYPLAFSIFLVAGISDMLDGWIARKFNQQSKLGSQLDPLADKILMGTMTVSLAIAGLLPMWLALLIVPRDLALLACGFTLRYQNLSPPVLHHAHRLAIFTIQFHPTSLSKANTALQTLLMASTLTLPALFGIIHHPLLTLIQIMTATTTILSAFDYMLLFRRM